MGIVVHLSRKTKIHRTSLSAANIITRKEGEDSYKTTLAWKIVSANPNKPYNYAELSVSVDILARQHAKAKILEESNKLDW